MKPFPLLLAAALILCAPLVGCRANTPESAPAPAESTSAESASPTAESADSPLCFTAPDGETVDLSLEYFTVTLERAYGYENTLWQSEEQPTSQAEEFTCYRADDVIGGARVTDAACTFIMGLGGTPEILQQRLSIHGAEITLSGIACENGRGEIRFYPYPESLKEAGLPCFFAYGSRGFSGDYLPVRQADGSYLCMNTMQFVLPEELAQELGEYAARGFVYAELELTFSEAAFDTAATIDGYTQADVNITNYSIKAQ